MQYGEKLIQYQEIQNQEKYRKLIQEEELSINKLETSSCLTMIKYEDEYEFIHDFIKDKITDSYYLEEELPCVYGTIYEEMKEDLCGIETQKRSQFIYNQFKEDSFTYYKQIEHYLMKSPYFIDGVFTRLKVK